MQNENTFYFSDVAEPIPVVVWGTGNMGRAAIRSVEANPALTLTAVVVGNPDKVGRDAGELADLGHDLGVAATTDVDAALATLGGAGAVAYMASGDIRPDDAAEDVRRALAAGAVVVTPAIYALYDQRNAPAELREPLLAAAREGGASLFVSGVDPGWGNDLLPVLVSALAGEIDQVRCQEIFDYSTYDAPDAVRYAVGMGEPMDYEPLMVAPGVPDRGLGRPGAPDRPRPRRTGGRDPGDAGAPRARRGRHELDGAVRQGHPGRAAVRGAGHRRRRAGDRGRARHPDRSGRGTRTGRSRPTAATAPTRSSSRAGRASR